MLKRCFVARAKKCFETEQSFPLPLRASPALPFSLFYSFPHPPWKVFTQSLSRVTSGTVDRLFLTTPPSPHKALCNGGLSFVFCPAPWCNNLHSMLLSSALLFANNYSSGGWPADHWPQQTRITSVSPDLDWITRSSQQSSEQVLSPQFIEWFIWFQVRCSLVQSARSDC